MEFWKQLQQMKNWNSENNYNKRQIGILKTTMENDKLEL